MSLPAGNSEPALNPMGRLAEPGAFSQFHACGSSRRGPAFQKMSEHTFHLIGGVDDETASVTCEPRDGQCHLTLHYRGRALEASATDYFEAFCQVRSRLEKENLIPFCYGASLNVFPSGMCRDMSAGMQAYRLTIGRHTSPKQDLVDIFEAGPDVIPATVARQKEYFKEWLGSKKA